MTPEEAAKFRNEVVSGKQRNRAQFILAFTIGMVGYAAGFSSGGSLPAGTSFEGFSLIVGVMWGILALAIVLVVDMVATERWNRLVVLSTIEHESTLEALNAINKRLDKLGSNAA